MVAFIVDLCTFSPNGLSLACMIQTDNRIIIRSCDDKLKVENKFTVAHVPIDKLVWSQDSVFIAASCKKDAEINIFSILDKKWKCKISFGILDKGGIGIENVIWAPDARHILCTSQEFTFLSVWSIRNKCVQYLKDIAGIEHGLTFPPDGSAIGIAQVNDYGKPSSSVAIYSCKTWTKERGFSIACKDLAGISWSPNNSVDCIVCWDSNLFSNLYIYDANKGQLLQHYSPHGLSSGFKSVEWCGMGDFLVCTTHRNEIHVLNGLTFGILIHELLEPTSASPPYDIFYEPNKSSTLGMNKYVKVSKWPQVLLENSVLCLSSYKDSCNAPMGLPEWTVRVKVNTDGNYIACNSHLYPQIVWVYDLPLGELTAVLIHQYPVLDFDWNPNSSQLAILCSQTSGLLYFWTDNHSTSTYIQNRTIQLTTGLAVSLKWSPLGNFLTLRDGDKLHIISDL